MITSAKLSTQVSLSSSVTPDLSFVSQSATITDTKAVSTGALWSDSRTITGGVDTIDFTTLTDSYGAARDIGNIRALIVENTSASGSIALATSTSTVTGYAEHTVTSALASTYINTVGALFVSGSVTPQVVIPAGGSYSLVMDAGFVAVPSVVLTSATTGSTYDLIAIGGESGHAQIKIIVSDCTGDPVPATPGMSFGITVGGIEYTFSVIWGTEDPYRPEGSNGGNSYGLIPATGTPWLARVDGTLTINDCFGYLFPEFTTTTDEVNNPVITPVSGRIESARAIGEFTTIELLENVIW